MLRFLSHTTKKCDALLIRRNSYGTDLKRTRSGLDVGEQGVGETTISCVDWFPPTSSYQKLLLLIKPWKDR